MRPEAVVLSVFILAAMMIVCSVLALRYRNEQLRHQERMAALEKGVNVVPEGRAPAPWSPRVYLLRGLMWTLIGAALTVALLGTAMTHRYQPASAEEQAFRAGQVSNNLNMPIGQAREIVAKDEAARSGQTQGPPTAIALFGLIPLGVGLAYLIFYYTDPARKATGANL